MQTNLQADQWLLEDRVMQGVGLDYKGEQGKFQGDEYGHYVKWCNGFMDMNIC